MNVSTSETTPDETEAPRPRRAHAVIPRAWAEEDPRLGQLDDVSRRSLVGFEFLLISLLAGLLVGGALLTDSPALILLAILAAPFPSPVIGLSLSTLAGSGRFFLQSFGGMLLGAIPLFLGAAAAGYASHYYPFLMPVTLMRMAEFNWPGFVVLSTGSLLSALAYLRSRGRHLLPGVALAYGLYLPLAAAGYALGSGLVSLFLSMTLLYAGGLAWSVLLGTIVLLAAGQRPFGFSGYLLGTGILAACLVLLLGFSGLGARLIQKLPAWLTLPGTHATPTALALIPTAAITTPVQAATQVTDTNSPTAIHSTGSEATQPGWQATTVAPVGSTTPTPNTAIPSTRTPKPTNTLIPTQTPITSTPVPTPVWALIHATGSDGAFIRSEPRAGSKLLTSLLNGSLVEVLAETVQEGTNVWVHIRTDRGLEGWIIQSLLATATPSPQW